MTVVSAKGNIRHLIYSLFDGSYSAALNCGPSTTGAAEPLCDWATCPERVIRNTPLGLNDTKTKDRNVRAINV
jgi:hypothetical protein